MEASEPGNYSTECRAVSDDGYKSEGVKVFEADAWIPLWEQSLPGKSIVLDSIPASCSIFLDPEPYFAIEVKLEDQEALRYHRIITQQGDRVPMQFEGLQYSNYPIRWNNYVSWKIGKSGMQVRAKYRLLDEGLRSLRLADEPTAEVQGFVINLAINNYHPLTLRLNHWIVTLSPQLRRNDDESNFTITHEVKITSDRRHFSDAELGDFRDKLRILFSVINMQCCEIALTQTYDDRSTLTGFMIDQLHCDPFNSDVLQYTMGSSQQNEEVKEIASKLYRLMQASQPQYLEALQMLTCSSHQSIPSLWTILEKTCGSGPPNVREALKHCVESTRVPSEYAFLTNELNVKPDADFVDIFYGMRNHFAHEKSRIARGRIISPETHTIVKRLAQLLCWSKVLTDIDVRCLLWQDARVSFADWDFAQLEDQVTILKKFHADGTYNALAAIHRILRGGETPKRTSAFFETPEGAVVFCEATDWPREIPKRRPSAR